MVLKMTCDSLQKVESEFTKIIDLYDSLILFFLEIIGETIISKFLN